MLLSEHHAEHRAIRSLRRGRGGGQLPGGRPRLEHDPASDLEENFGAGGIPSHGGWAVRSLDPPCHTTARGRALAQYAQRVLGDISNPADDWQALITGGTCPAGRGRDDNIAGWPKVLYRLSTNLAELKVDVEVGVSPEELVRKVHTRQLDIACVVPPAVAGAGPRQRAVLRGRDVLDCARRTMDRKAAHARGACSTSDPDAVQQPPHPGD